MVLVAISNVAECRFIQLTQTGKNCSANDYLISPRFAVFRTLLEGWEQKVNLQSILFSICPLLFSCQHSINTKEMPCIEIPKKEGPSRVISDFMPDFG
jgi:hypothetical protein